MNVRAAFIHVIGDVFQSLGVITAGVCVWTHPNDSKWALADPIATFVFSIIVLTTSFRIIRDISDILLERYPRWLDQKKVLESLQQVNGVERVHDLHCWSLTNDLSVLTAHVDVKTDANNAQVLLEAERVLKGLKIDHVRRARHPPCGSAPVAQVAPTPFCVWMRSSPSRSSRR